MPSLVDCSTFPSSSTVADDDDDNCLPKNMTFSWGTDSDDEDPVDMETTCPGLGFTKKEEEEISRNWLDWYINACAEDSRLCNELLRNGINDSSSLPPPPLKVLPKTTESCIERGYCHHREYMTNETCETSQNLGSFEPKEMLQVLSLRLSHTEPRPVRVYGIFAIRDDLEPLRNYIFNRTRDDPVVIDEDSFVLPLCSPCRGMYVLERALLEVDLWIKNEGDRSTDEQLLSEYVEIELRSCLDHTLHGRIYGDRCMLDMNYMFLAMSVAAIIQVSALADNPSSHVRFIAYSSYFDDEIILFKGDGVVKGEELIRHVVAVKPEEKLGVRLELGDLVFEWTFQNGVFSSPADLITNQFHVMVFFAPDNPAPIRSRYYDWKRRCRLQQKISGQHLVRAG